MQRTSRVVEDYVTLVWKSYEWPGDRATTTDLAARLGVTPSTVSANLKRLARSGLIDYEPYGSITLTDEGSAIAMRIVHRHRVIEAYLATSLGFDWDEVHDEADRLEHAVSDRLLDRMDAVAGRPDFDPHGDPIPRAGATPAVPSTVPLADATVGDVVTVLRVSDRHPEVLRYLASKGVVLGVAIEVVAPLDAGGAMIVRIDGEDVEVNATAAEAVRVAAESR